MCLMAEAFVFIAMIASITNRIILEVKQVEVVFFPARVLAIQFCIISFPEKYSWIKPDPVFAGFLK